MQVQFSNLCSLIWLYHGFLYGSFSSTATALPWQALLFAGGVVDVQGVCKSTVAKGEDDFPDGVLRITDCHDSVIYALAPLQYASITCCSDCTVVVGAVGRMLRVERCERLQLIAGCVRICISSCHDCVFYLGVNRAPLMLGDNRFVQVTYQPVLPVSTQQGFMTALHGMLTTSCVPVQSIMPV